MNKQMDSSHKIDRVTDWLGAGSVNIFGMLLSGKDTQGKKLAETLHGNLISGGDILRGSEIPERAKKALDTGDLIPTEDYLNIVTPYFKRSEFAQKPLFLSAVGRWLGEEQVILKAAIDSGHPIKSVILLKMSEATAYERLEGALRNRPDDTKEVLAHRIEEFHSKTMPVIEIYRDLGLLVEVDGAKSQDEVFIQIIDKLYHQAESPDR